MKLRTFVLAVLAAAALVPGASARPGPPPAPGGFGMGKFWKRPELRAALRLSDAQVKSLDEVFLRHQRALVDLKAEVEKRQLDLDELLSDDRADEKKLSSAVESLEDARGRLGKSRALMMLEVRRVLTPDQRRKLEEMREERRDDRRERRPPPRGGRRGPPPGDFDGPPEGPPPEDPL